MWITHCILTKTTPHLTMLNMATLLQKNLAQNLVKNAKSPKKRNKKELVVLSGYSEVTADRHSKTIIEQKGVQEELKSLGFTEENAKRVVREVMNSKYSEDRDRLKAAELVFKVHGTFAAEKAVNLNVSASVDEVRSTISETLSRFREVRE
jgi:hypothetical protein